jgi:HK97 family phage major capsid protein
MDYDIYDRAQERAVHDHAPEVKAGIASEAGGAYDALMRAFDAFKEANDERLGALERRSADVLTDEKVERINAALDAQGRRLDEITLKAARPALSTTSAGVQTQNAREHKAAFDSYVRTGESAGLRALEVKALSVGSNPDGGYLVPPEVETEIGRRLTAVSPIRSIAGIREISANVYKKPFGKRSPQFAQVPQRSDLHDDFAALVSLSVRVNSPQSDEFVATVLRRVPERLNGNGNHS